MRPRTIRPRMKHPLDDPSPGRSVPWTIRPLDNPSPGRSVPWTIRPLDEPSPGRSVPMIKRPHGFFSRNGLNIPNFLGTFCPFGTHHNNANLQHFRCGGAAANATAASRPSPKPPGSEPPVLTPPEPELAGRGPKPASPGPPRARTAWLGATGPEPASQELPCTGAAAAQPEIIVEPASFASLALGMFCHKKIYQSF
jgi:hypothetical protein